MADVIRTDIKVGYRCNNNCYFCAQAHNRSKGNKTTEQIKVDLENARKNKCEGVVFTGGEPTIRDDILELVQYARMVGFKIIQLQSNGRRFFYKKFCEDCIKAGANEFSPALHGHIPELHDYLTRSPGAFKQIIQGMKNLRDLGQNMISNSVVVKANYRYLPELAKLLVRLRVKQFQMAFVHGCGNAEINFDQVIPFKSLAAPYIKRALQIGIDAGVNVMAEAMPYCMMEGYEKYVSELYIPRAEIREYDFYIEDFEKMRKEELKYKFLQCKQCKYDLVCEGPWKEYPDKRGIDEFKPVPGKKIQDIREILDN